QCQANGKGAARADALDQANGLETMLHAAVDRKILRRFRTGGRFAVLFASIVFGRAVKQLETEVHFGQRAELTKTRDADLGPFLALRRGLILHLRFRSIRRSVRDRHTLLVKRECSGGRSSGNGRQHAKHQCCSSHQNPAMPCKHAHVILMSGRSSNFNALFRPLALTVPFLVMLLYHRHVADATQKFPNITGLELASFRRNAKRAALQAALPF
ncbi:MAG: hypothetical protein J0H04_08180, partial [Hyphomicrobium denitrificans]|nr:hypothetical protein [Hyphomicrobium denitrificans]